MKEIRQIIEQINIQEPLEKPVTPILSQKAVVPPSPFVEKSPSVEPTNKTPVISEDKIEKEKKLLQMGKVVKGGELEILRLRELMKLQNRWVKNTIKAMEKEKKKKSYFEAMRE